MSTTHEIFRRHIYHRYSNQHLSGLILHQSLLEIYFIFSFMLLIYLERPISSTWLSFYSVFKPCSLGSTGSLWWIILPGQPGSVKLGTISYIVTDWIFVCLEVYGKLTQRTKSVVCTSAGWWLFSENAAWPSAGREIEMLGPSPS